MSHTFYSIRNCGCHLSFFNADNGCMMKLGLANLNYSCIEYLMYERSESIAFANMDLSHREYQMQETYESSESCLVEFVVLEVLDARDMVGH